MRKYCGTMGLRIFIPLSIDIKLYCTSINIGKVEVIFVSIKKSNLLATFISFILQYQAACYAQKETSGCQVKHGIVQWIHVVSSRLCYLR